MTNGDVSHALVLAFRLSESADAKARPELDQIAVYFLFGGAEESAKPVGLHRQTEDVRKRLDHHNTNKDFWRGNRGPKGTYFGGEFGPTLEVVEPA